MNGASIYFDRFFFSSIAHLKNNILKIPQKPIAGWWDERGLKFELKSCPVIWKIWIWLLTANCVIRRSRRMCFFRIYFDVVGQQKKFLGRKIWKGFSDYMIIFRSLPLFCHDDDVAQIWSKIEKKVEIWEDIFFFACELLTFWRILLCEKKTF